MPTRLRRFRLSAIGSIYVLIPLIVIAATALAYYSYRSADQLARRGEESVIETTDELASIQMARVERIILDSDEALFSTIDLDNLRRLKDVMELSPVVESAIVLDDRLQIKTDGYKSKKLPAEEKEFRQLFEQKIKPSLGLGLLLDDEHAHLHAEFDGRYALISYTRQRSGWRTYYVVLENDLAHLVSEVFPEIFAGVENDHLYQIVDEYDNVVFGHRFEFENIPVRYVVSKRFPSTLRAWTMRMAPRDTRSLIAKQSARRGYGGVLIILSAATIFVGLGILTFAVRTERHANRLKGEFIANVSHELKTPLSLIRMFGELLASGRAGSAETAREYAEIITRESERLARLIDNVLDFARIERGKAAYSFQIGDLAEVLSRGLDVYRFRIEREGMKLTSHIPEDLPPVRIDENAMTLVLLNLIDNAVKYGASGKEIEVSLAHEKSPQGGDRVLLQVRDHGPGIEVGEQGRIFERFYRAKEVRTRPVRGSGIGLSLVKHVALAHGGGVTVDSEPGKGATFTVWLPVAAPESEPVAETGDGSRVA